MRAAVVIIGLLLALGVLVDGMAKRPLHGPLDAHREVDLTMFGIGVAILVGLASMIASAKPQLSMVLLFVSAFVSMSIAGYGYTAHLGYAAGIFILVVLAFLAGGGQFRGRMRDRRAREDRPRAGSWGMISFGLDEIDGGGNE